MRLIPKVAEWFDLRLQLGTPIRETAEHPVPRESELARDVHRKVSLSDAALLISYGDDPSGGGLPSRPAVGLPRTRDSLKGCHGQLLISPS